MKKRVYIETSIVSYLTARPSKDIIVAARQKITHAWWERRRPAFDLQISQFVVDEASAGDPDAAKRRLEALKDIPVLSDLLAARYLGRELVWQGLLPQAAEVDALHLAMATVHGVDFLLTWNCSHLANAELLKGIAVIMQMKGYEMPAVCTPEGLMGGEEI